MLHIFFQILNFFTSCRSVTVSHVADYECAPIYIYIYMPLSIHSSIHPSVHLSIATWPTMESVNSCIYINGFKSIATPVISCIYSHNHHHHKITCKTAAKVISCSCLALFYVCQTIFTYICRHSSIEDYKCHQGFITYYELLVPH